MEQIGDSLRQGQEQRSKSQRYFKQFAMAILSTGLLVLDWWLIKEAVFNGQQAAYWIWPLLVTLLWIPFTSFFALTNPDRISFFTFNALGLIGYLVIMPQNPYIFAAGAVFFLLNMWFQSRVKDEQKNQLNFSIRRTLGNTQMIITYALIITLGFMIYANVRDDFNKDKDVFYRRLAETTVKGLPYLSSDRSSYNLNQSVDEFFRRQAQQEFPQFNQVSASQQRILMEQIRESFRQQFGINARGNESLRVAMTEVVIQRLKETLGRFEKFFPLLFTILILTLMRTFAFIFNWLVLFVSWLLFKILMIARFFKIGKQTIEVEKLEI